MRAVRFDRFGPPSVLRVADVPDPRATADEAVVAVRAAAINPSDVKNVAGGMAQTKPPRTPGRDFAGVVVDGPDGWKGSAVWGSGGDLGFTRDGTHAEKLLVPVAALRRKPAHLDFSGAAAVGTPFVTAQLGLGRAQLRTGEVVLVAGAAGSVGSAAAQIAAWRGARVLHLVRGQPLAAIDEPADVIFDTTGVLLPELVPHLAHGGRVVVIAAPPDGNVTFNLRELYRRDGMIIGVDSLALSAVDAAEILDELAPGFESGALRPPAVIERPLEDAIAGYQATHGKQVLVPVEPGAPNPPRPPHAPHAKESR